MFLTVTQSCVSRGTGPELLMPMEKKTGPFPPCRATGVQEGDRVRLPRVGDWAAVVDVLAARG